MIRYEENNDGGIDTVHYTEIDGKEVVIRKEPVHNSNEQSIYLAKRRGDIMEDIAIRQQELADIEAEIASFDKVSEIEVGDKKPEEIIIEIETNTINLTK